MATKSSRGDLGKRAERLVQDWLENKSASDLAFAYHRYPDARAARGALANQPADFEVAYSPFCFNLEVKTTANPNRLPRSKVSQWATLRKFDKAGKQAYIVIHRSAHDDWVVLDSAALFNHDEAPASFPFSGLQSYPSAAAALESIFP